MILIFILYIKNLTLKFIITESKLTNIVQKAIDYQLNELKSLKKSNVDIPDDISDGTWEDIESVKKITVSDIIKSKFEITNEIAYKVVVDVVYDSVMGIALDDILYDLLARIRRMLSIGIYQYDINETRNLYKEYGQW